MKMHKLKNNYCEVVTNGPSLISFKINKNDINYEILGYDLENFVSSFIMAPWVNRIKEGIFNFTEQMRETGTAYFGPYKREVKKNQNNGRLN